MLLKISQFIFFIASTAVVREVGKCGSLFFLKSWHKLYYFKVLLFKLSCKNVNCSRTQMFLNWTEIRPTTEKSTLATLVRQSGPCGCLSLLCQFQNQSLMSNIRLIYYSCDSENVKKLCEFKRKYTVHCYSKRFGFGDFEYTQSTSVFLATTQQTLLVGVTSHRRNGSQNFRKSAAPYSQNLNIIHIIRRAHIQRPCTYHGDMRGLGNA